MYIIELYQGKAYEKLKEKQRLERKESRKREKSMDDDAEDDDDVEVEEEPSKFERKMSKLPNCYLRMVMGLYFIKTSILSALHIMYNRYL